MRVFLVMETFFFGALFSAYAVCRALHEADFALASHKTDLFLGGAGAVALLTSGLTMVLAARAARQGRRAALVGLLAATMALGMAFLTLKGLEWSRQAREGLFPASLFSWEPQRQGAQLFFALYFSLTGLHALHLIAGMLILGAVALMAAAGRLRAGEENIVEASGLYWQFAGILWIFLLPAFYLIGGRR